MRLITIINRYNFCGSESSRQKDNKKVILLVVDKRLWEINFESVDDCFEQTEANCSMHV